MGATRIDVAGDQHQKLVRALARHHVRLRQAAQSRSHFTQQPVTHTVAEGFVDGLEAIEVDQQQRELSLVGIGALQRLCQGALEDLPVGQLGERIAQGLELQLSAGGLQRRLHPRFKVGHHQQHHQQQDRAHRGEHFHRVGGDAAVDRHACLTANRRRSQDQALRQHHRHGDDQGAQQAPDLHRRPGAPFRPGVKPQGHPETQRRDQPTRARSPPSPVDAGQGPQAQQQAHFAKHHTQRQHRGTGQGIDGTAGPTRQGQAQKHEDHTRQPASEDQTRVVAQRIRQAQVRQAQHTARPQPGTQCQCRAGQPAQAVGRQLALQSLGQIQRHIGRQKSQRQIGDHHGRHSAGSRPPHEQGLR